jgi:hypothetical protein
MKRGTKERCASTCIGTSFRGRWPHMQGGVWRLQQQEGIVSSRAAAGAEAAADNFSHCVTAEYAPVFAYGCRGGYSRRVCCDTRFRRQGGVRPALCASPRAGCRSGGFLGRDRAAPSSLTRSVDAGVVSQGGCLTTTRNFYNGVVKISSSLSATANCCVFPSPCC